jgi:hypothetical protein
MIQRIQAELNRLTVALNDLCGKYSELSLVSVAQAESTDVERIKRELECVGCVKVVLPSYAAGISARAYLDHEILPRLRDLDYEVELSGYGSDFYVSTNGLRFYVRVNSRGSFFNVSNSGSVPALSGSGDSEEDVFE